MALLAYTSSSAKECHLSSATLSTPALDKARALSVPSREEVLRRDQSVYNFWNHNEDLLEEAWKEWQTTEDYKALPKLDDSLIHPKLREVVDTIWRSVNAGEFDQVATEELVAPGVYSAQFLDLSKVNILRQWFDAAAASGIPIRPPYGIVLNRKGFMMDPRSVGYWAAPDVQAFHKDVLNDSYIRPISRLFFPDSIIATDDSESFAFSIQYQVGGDESIRHHTDASTVTFNINLDEKKLYGLDRLLGILEWWKTIHGGLGSWKGHDALGSDLARGSSH